ncbi:MAG: hypothetical protein ACLTYN_01645 [Dysosmobacter welbionis]
MRSKNGTSGPRLSGTLPAECRIPLSLSTVLAAGVTTAEAAAEALEGDRSLSMSPC